MEEEDQAVAEPTALRSPKENALTLTEALVPVVALVGMLAYNVHVYGNAALDGSNQFILLLGGGVAALVGFRRRVPYARMLDEVADNIKSTTGALLILLMTGALSGTWMLSGDYSDHDLLRPAAAESDRILGRQRGDLCDHLGGHRQQLDHFGHRGDCPDRDRQRPGGVGRDDGRGGDLRSLLRRQALAPERYHQPGSGHGGGRTLRRTSAT